MPPKSPEKKIIVAHVPVIHAGYLDLFERHEDADIGVLGTDILERFTYLKKEIRALSPNQAVKILQGIGRRALTVSLETMALIAEEYDTVVMPSDDISRTLSAEFAEGVLIEPIFLRWDRDNTKVNVEVVPDEIISPDDLPVFLAAATIKEADKSSSWWRQVGAVIVGKDGQEISRGHNSSLPTEYSNWIDGDPRNTARRGESIELSIDIHAEAQLIAAAAKNGTPLEGASICVSTFPCPNCAKLIAKSGIKKCYFVEGYAMLDGQSVLKTADISIIKIETGEKQATDPLASRPYPPR